jgi:putative hemolysin
MNYAVRAVEGMKSGIVAFSPIQKDFSTRVPVHFTRGNFTVKTVENRRELWQVFKLRYEVFHREYKNRKFPFGIDRDRYDQWADHLAIVDNRIGKVIGTYRLINSAVSTDFYSASEFDISALNKFEGGQVELSRACIHRSYRNGAVINMLWRGICDYVATAGARILFGMGSIKTTNHAEIAAVYRQLLSEGFIDSNLKVAARSDYRIPEFERLVSDAIPSQEAAEQVPALVRSYLKAGAVIGTDVALDSDFNCADLFIVMDMTRVSAMFSRKYQIH